MEGLQFWPKGPDIRYHADLVTLCSREGLSRAARLRMRVRYKAVVMIKAGDQVGYV
jgi:hypothetical protein